MNNSDIAPDSSTPAVPPEGMKTLVKISSALPVDEVRRSIQALSNRIRLLRDEEARAKRTMQNARTRSQHHEIVRHDEEMRIAVEKHYKDDMERKRLLIRDKNINIRESIKASLANGRKVVHEYHTKAAVETRSLLNELNVKRQSAAREERRQLESRAASIRRERIQLKTRMDTAKRERVDQIINSHNTELQHKQQELNQQSEYIRILENEEAVLLARLSKIESSRKEFYNRLKPVAQSLSPLKLAQSDQSVDLSPASTSDGGKVEPATR